MRTGSSLFSPKKIIQINKIFYVTSFTKENSESNLVLLADIFAYFFARLPIIYEFKLCIRLDIGAVI